LTQWIKQPLLDVNKIGGLRGDNQIHGIVRLWMSSQSQ
jgi:hypothetical protein